MGREPQPNPRIAQLALAAIGISLLSACTGTKAAAPTVPVVPVLAASVEQKDVPIRVHAIGTVEAYSTVVVKTQITGELTGVFFKEGDDVHKGQLLFTLDKRPLEADLNRAQSNLAKDEAAAANARVQQKRYEALVKAGVVSKEQYDQLESTAQAADAAVAADKAAVENAKVQLIYCSIYSPINGRTGNLIVHQGNMIKANDVPPLVNINQVEPIYVTFTVPQQYLAEVKQYSHSGSLPVQAVIPGVTANDTRAPVTGKLITALRRLGFDAVFDTNFGADLTIIEEAHEFVHRRRREDKIARDVALLPPAVNDFHRLHAQSS